MVEADYWTRPQTRKAISTGSFSTIYLVTFTERRPPYPYKVVMKTLVSPAEAAVHRQVACMCANIVQYYDYREGSLFVELADWGDGEKLLQSLAVYGKYTEDHLVKLLFQLLTAVEIMHRNGWVHRDIKPANVLIFSGKTAKLCDFGSSKRIFDPCDCHTVRGTPAFMSPALLSAHDALYVKARTDPFQDDIYALGCTIFNFARLQLISEFGDITDEVSAQLLENYIRAELEAFSAGFQDLVLAMVTREGGKRVSASEALRIIGRLSSPLEKRSLSQCLRCCLQPASVALGCMHRFCQACLQTIVSTTRLCPVCKQSL